jgi:hypothetical protein
MTLQQIRQSLAAYWDSLAQYCYSTVEEALYHLGMVIGLHSGLNNGASSQQRADAFN